MYTVTHKLTCRLALENGFKKETRDAKLALAKVLTDTDTNTDTNTDMLDIDIDIDTNPNLPTAHSSQTQPHLIHDTLALAFTLAQDQEVCTLQYLQPSQRMHADSRHQQFSCLGTGSGRGGRCCNPPVLCSMQSPRPRVRRREGCACVFLSVLMGMGLCL